LRPMESAIQMEIVAAYSRGPSFSCASRMAGSYPYVLIWTFGQASAIVSRDRKRNSESVYDQPYHLRWRKEFSSQRDCV